MVSSRYYSPELCRWISPDSIEYLAPSTINGLNLYCYANNNPISIAYNCLNVGGSASCGMVSSLASGGNIDSSGSRIGIGGNTVASSWMKT